MRTIKFRAWDKEIKQMYQVDTLGLNGGSTFTHSAEPILNEETGETDTCKLLDNCEIMQFTGLLDKNEKEIYEGDVINISETSYHKEFNAKIKFEEGKFIIDNFLAGDLCNFNQSCEVVGNLYENGSLLNK